MGRFPLSMMSKMPWYSDEYLYSMKARFPGFENYTREDLFQVLYENVDRESPVYEEEFDVAMDAYELSHGKVENEIGTETLYTDNSIKLIADDDRLLSYLFKDLPAINAERILNAITASVPSLGSCHLVLGVVPLSNNGNISGLSESLKPYKLSFGSKAGFNKIHKTLKHQRLLLTLSITAKGEKGVYSLATQLLQFPPETNKNGPILNKSLNLDEFIEIFNQADLSI